MAETPLFDQMSALLTYANGITGAGDTHLGDAVRSLADGYGGGGGGTPYASGDVYITGTTITITHNLGRVPTVVMLDIDDSGISTTTTQYLSYQVSMFNGGTLYARTRNSVKYQIAGIIASDTINANETTVTINRAHQQSNAVYHWRVY